MPASNAIRHVASRSFAILHAPFHMQSLEMLYAAHRRNTHAPLGPCTLLKDGPCMFKCDCSCSVHEKPLTAHLRPAAGFAHGLLRSCTLLHHHNPRCRVGRYLARSKLSSLSRLCGGLCSHPDHALADQVASMQNLQIAHMLRTLNFMCLHNIRVSCCQASFSNQYLFQNLHCACPGLVQAEPPPLLDSHAASQANHHEEAL